jgi:GT2 family glycosyltransferase
MSEKDIDVSIILVNYNTYRMTCECIDSIIKQTTGVTYEIIVVDNDSKDESQTEFAKDDRVIFIESGGNIGFGRANNLGVERAKGKYLFFLNTDTLLLNNAIKMLFDYSEQHKDEKIGAVGGFLINGENKPVFSGGKFLTLKIIFDTITTHFGHRPNAYGSIRENTTPKNEVDVDYVSGADIFVSKSIVDKYSAFDPDFFMYYEENEMQYRWAKNGYQSRLINGPQIKHLVGASINKGKKKNAVNYNKILINRRSEMIYFKKCHSHFCYLMYRACFFLYIIDDILRRNKPSFIMSELKLSLSRI